MIEFAIAMLVYAAIGVVISFLIVGSAFMIGFMFDR